MTIEDMLYILAFVITIIVAAYIINAEVIKRREVEKYYDSLNNRYQRELDGKHKADKEIHYLQNRIFNLEKENLKLKEENVPRETFNKGYGNPEVVNWINAQYPTGEDSN